jgi:hypothetical protein
LRVGEAQISSDGLSLKVAGGTSTEPTLPQQLVDKMPGSFSGVDCDSGQSLDEKLTKTSIVEALIDVDLVNQVLHGLWTSGYTHLTLTKDTLGELLDEPLLANATIVLAPDLPVVMTTCSEQGDVTFEIGDLLADISFGPDNAVTTYISMSASADLGVIAVPDAPDVLGLNSLNIERLALDIQSTEGLDFVDMEGLRELLTTLITEQLAGDFMVSLLDGLLRGLPLPTVALETLLPELEEGSDLGFEPSVLNSDGRHILLGGELVPPDAVNAPTP